MKNNLKRLVALGRVVPITKVLENGDIAVIAFKRKSAASKKCKQLYVLTKPIVMNVGKDESKVSDKDGKNTSSEGTGVTICDFNGSPKELSPNPVSSDKLSNSS